MKPSRRWISTTLSAFAAACLAGCQPAHDEYVWVDLQHAAEVVAAAETIAWPVAGTPPVLVPNSIAELPGVAGTLIDRTVVASRRAEAQAILTEQLRETQQKLEAAYQVQLRATARALASDLREALRDRISEGHELTISAVERLITASAEERGPKVVRLALLAGWPDDGRSDFVRFANRRGAVEEAWDDEADRLRRELQEHDELVTRQLEALLARFDDMIAAERQANEQRVQEETRRADEAAAAQARQRFQETARLTLPRLLAAGTGFVGGREATTLQLPGVRLEGIALTPPQPTEPAVDTLRSRLDIWLAVRGYKLAAGPEQAPDFTGEFIAWINQP